MATFGPKMTHIQDFSICTSVKQTASCILFAIWGAKISSLINKAKMRHYAGRARVRVVRERKKMQFVKIFAMQMYCHKTECF